MTSTPFRYSHQRASTLASLTAVLIGIDILAVTACVVLVFFLKYVPVWVLLLMVSILLVIAVPTILYLLGRRRVLTGPLKDGSLQNAQLIVDQAGLSIGPPNGVQRFDWQALAGVTTETGVSDPDALPGTGVRALVLFQQHPVLPFSGAVRRQIVKAARNSAWAPVVMDGMTILPLRFISGGTLETARVALEQYRQAQNAG